MTHLQFNALDEINIQIISSIYQDASDYILTKPTEIFHKKVNASGRLERGKRKPTPIPTR
jgi:hypothetical protein